MISREHRLLVEFGRLRPFASTSPDEAVDWKTVVAAARQHGVAPLLFKNLTACPDETRHALRQNYIESAHRGARFQVELAALLENFERGGIEAMPLKGAHLAGNIYTDPALRPYRDLDVLVRAEKIDAAKKTLALSGFVLSPSLWSEKMSRRFHFNLPFVKPGPQPVHLELHWALNARTRGHGLEVAGLWSRAAATKSGYALAPEDLLVYLATHLDAHGFLNRALADHDNGDALLFHELSHNRLIWFVDLLEVLASFGDRFKWDHILQRAHEGRVAGSVGTSLRLLHLLYGNVVPDGVLKSLKPAPSKFWHRAAVRWLLKSDRKPAGAEFLLSTRKGFEIRLIRLLDIFAA